MLDAEIEAVFSELCRLDDGAINWMEFVARVWPEYREAEVAPVAVKVPDLYRALHWLLIAIGSTVDPGTSLQSACGVVDVDGVGTVPYPVLAAVLADTFHVDVTPDIAAVIQSQFRLPGRPPSDDRINYLQLADAVNGVAHGQPVASDDPVADAAVAQLVDDRAASLFELCARLAHIHGDGRSGVAAAFASMDDNDSGLLSREEIELCLVRLGFAYTPTAVLDALYSSLDLNSDGLVSLDELQQFVTRMAVKYVGTTGSQSMQSGSALLSPLASTPSRQQQPQHALRSPASSTAASTGRQTPSSGRPPRVGTVSSAALRTPSHKAGGGGATNGRSFTFGSPVLPWTHGQGQRSTVCLGTGLIGSVARSELGEEGAVCDHADSSGGATIVVSTPRSGHGTLTVDTGVAFPKLHLQMPPALSNSSSPVGSAFLNSGPSFAPVTVPSPIKASPLHNQPTVFSKTELAVALAKTGSSLSGAELDTLYSHWVADSARQLLSPLVSPPGVGGRQSAHPRVREVVSELAHVQELSGTVLTPHEVDVVVGSQALEAHAVIDYATFVNQVADVTLGISGKAYGGALSVHDVNKAVLKVAMNLCADDTRSIPFVEKVFRTVDKSASGTITLDQFHAVLSKLGLSPQDEETELFSRWYDVNCDGNVTYPEFLSQLVEYMLGVKAGGTGAAEVVSLVKAGTTSSLLKRPLDLVSRVSSLVKSKGLSSATLRRRFRAAAAGVVATASVSPKAARTPAVVIPSPPRSPTRVGGGGSMLKLPSPHAKSPSSTASRTPTSKFAKMRALPLAGDAFSIVRSPAKEKSPLSSPVRGKPAAPPVPDNDDFRDPVPRIEGKGGPLVVEPVQFIAALQEVGVTLDQGEAELLLTMQSKRPLEGGDTAVPTMGVDVDSFLTRLEDAAAVQRYKQWTAVLKERAGRVASRPSQFTRVLADVREKFKRKFATRRGVDDVLSGLQLKHPSQLPLHVECELGPEEKFPCSSGAFLCPRDVGRAFAALGIAVTGHDVDALMSGFDPTGSGVVLCGALFDALCVVFPSGGVSRLGILSPSTLRLV